MVPIQKQYVLIWISIDRTFFVLSEIKKKSNLADRMDFY